MAVSVLVTCVLVLLAAKTSGAARGKAPTMELNDGNRIPALALGTGRGTAPDRSNVSEVRQAVHWALELGYRHIDTAAVYRDEREVGEGIADAVRDKIVTREDVFVTTKLWNNRHAKEQVVPALRDSLQKLGLSYVDLYLVHFPLAQDDNDGPLDIDYLETWEGMEEAKRLGLTKSIGISNFNATQLERLVANSKIKPAVHQFEVNPTLTQHHLVDVSKKLGMAVMAYSPFGFMVQRRGSDLPPPRADDPLLKAMAEKYNKTTTQIVLGYLTNRGLIPIPKSTNKERLAQNIDVFDFKLTEEEIAAIDKFNKNIRVIKPDYWKDYPNYPFGSESSS